MLNNLKEKFKIWLSNEIAVEYKACIYFGCILAFACFYYLYEGVYYVQILHVFEIIMTAYVVGYLQIYFFHNFDEAEKIDGRCILGALLCTGIYTTASWLLGWFERNLTAQILFAGYMLLLFFCIYLINKVKRMADTEKLNGMLAEFKKGESNGKKKCN